ncbi:diguanylate cyclase (GGDEF) domain-containing protein [Quadrisphaera granulorum]|uniref:Diguanylate cyclase (GGDEF)-like protein n=1 Tax=Quadrisphaera granulorum TaxID=317664 RepID=A0A316AH57_9ACTN|nr:GGDEF domain-containing protein [Quadrisphaera granulorum]PWJ56270.1 diguanylate cyclase (GGDEF)-like protein [Quadrisphaera granulorum]SZE94904.1 diguanylate cyclase (GGDEF) domain-containing protein [Quadrisphaera granulorum]
MHTTDPADRASAAGELLAAVGATDALLLRAAPTGGWRHVAGHGAGAPSAVQRAERRADRSADHLADRAVRGGGVVRVLSGSPVTVAADYRAATAAVVACEDDVVVVIGSPTRSERLLAASDDELRAAARRLAAVLDVPASGGLTGTGSLEGPVVDELRALHAVQELTGALRRSPAEAVERVARVLQEALGCQLAAVWLDGGPATVVRAVQTGRTGKGGPGSLDGVALDRATDTDVLVAARAAAAASATLGAPLRPEDGAVAALVLPLGGAEAAGGPTGGVLAVRSGPEAQPFSPLRRRIATQLVHTAGTVMAVVLARQKVEQQLSDTRLQLGRDALTDVGSRHRWDSELAAAQGLVNAGVPVAVALLDLDDLKLVNDEHGHAAGDELLRTCGAALRGCLRDSSDVVARVGGDEFAVLVPRVGDVDALVARLRAGVEAARTADGLPLRVSVGAARAEPGRTVAEAVAAADAAMYEDKRRRRAERARTSGRTGR